ncbi:plexin-A2 [Cephus cinctus]|uniref:Plexin-A2 n=1 Tax=Cephus cinctus TaxID=211228 RepID=A0AAJ7C2I4_CEPCN|nr:plexin-A2 [Cephus cinctus]XP_024942902.1 plexin-A2 [Cephus cinctus]XP_024942903.1 plexin-A2 [Cephus cinctus]
MSGKCPGAARVPFRGSHLPFLLLLLLRFSRATAPNVTDIIHKFYDPDVEKMNHLVVDKNTGRVYVGGVNRLYQLSPNLTLDVKVETGPRGDSNQCSSIDCPSEAVKRPVDNVNKALVIDYTTTRLISCGSVFQGMCNVRNLQNISDVVQEVREPVVANNATASTVAFIAPGPPNPPVSQVMYVGVTFTGNSPYRSEVPAVSSRSLEADRMLNIAQSAVTTGTRIYVNSLSRERYPITYVYGFSSEGFSYFLTTQPKNPDIMSYISKLVRLCHEDPHYYSYTEMSIECTSEDRVYNLVQAAYVGKPGSVLASDLGITAQDDVLFAVFSESNGTSSVPKPQSALCVYSLKAIRRKFLRNIQKCFGGEGQRGLDFISPSIKCVPTKLQTLGEDFCGLDVNTPLGAQEAITAVPVLTFDTLLTAVAATSTGDFTVVFLGTHKGHLKKVVVESGSAALEYGDLNIDADSPVLPDLLFDTQQMYLYVLTNQRVSKVKVQECSVYTTCWDCLGAKDPYCGWCSLENKCNLRSDCQDAAKDPLYWISYKSGRCTTITSVSPDQLQRTTARTLELVIENLPSLTGQFLCAFSALDKTLITNATRKSYGVNCTTPRTDLLPAIPTGQHHFTAKLSVRMTNGPDLVGTNFTFFDCNTYSSCTQCVSSNFPCDWCVDGHRCTHDTAENCRNDILVTGVSRMGPSYRSGPAFCPTLNATDSQEILVSSGLKKVIRVRVHIIGQFIIQTRFVCQFNIEGRVTSVNARLLADTIYCDETDFSYTSRAPNITVPFAVIWGGSKPLDNPDNIHVVIYRCRDMADNCGMCLALDKKYGCGWCQSSDRCEVKDQCDRGDGVWLNMNQTCPNPEIHSFEPRMGPWEGGTNMTIRGINLGKTFSDIFEGVTVAAATCQPYEKLYIRTKEIVCRIDGPGTPEEAKSGPVIVKVEDFRGQSEYNFKFVDPKIFSISPKFGPLSGGTIIRITGEFMNAGSRIEAFIDNLPCSIISAELNEALCMTSASDRKRNGVLKMRFDGGIREYDGFFEYVDDPTIESVESGVAGQMKIPKGIPAGGIRISVTGKNLGFIQNPQMYVYFDDKMFISQCTVFSHTNMNCNSPTIEVPENVLLDAEKPLSLEYGFRMDNVTGVQNLTQRGFNHFLLYPNPIYEVFDEEVKYYKSDYLTINGQHLDRACQESDVVVQIGNAFCNVTSLSRQQLTCRPPVSQPPALDSEGQPNKQELPEVVVIVGGSLQYSIGKLSYALPTGLNGPLSKPALIGVIAAILILVVVFIIFLIAYRRKSTENNRVLKNMQEQMDILELRVAAECKEAFAELQTEMTDLTGDLTSGGIPFLDYRTYAMKILFPNIDNHVVLQWERPELTHKEKGLRLFGQLIMNKTFLLLFVRTLESNRYFSMRDRVNVASFIMVTLQSKMEYCTDILKTLLAELIEKCMEGKSHPKLLLRRTESVAEKMLSAWFTFLLYKFLRECAGEPLYMLFRAMKQQVDKGPVDAITSEARYSLSEEKLIRQSIEFKPMTVYVSISQQTVFVGGMDPNTENVGVKVLDCDTISQVKEKALDTIYRSTPYSQRPRKDDLDLEWRTGASGRLILYDEDSTTKPESEWKKRNTLNHYRVPDGASLNLVSKQSSIYNLSILSEKTDKSHKYETLNLSKFSSASPPLSRATSPLNHDHDGGLKSWHLVKHHDTDAQKEGERGNKMVSEIYLTRLLATKGTLQKFVDDLFETIFSTAHRGSALPLAIKYMFDFLDDQALHHGISDPEVVHTWKSNSLPLRFWVNLIKNPNFVFDIHKSNIVDSCLSVVAQTFMDSCSTSDHRLGKDSPSSKLLYAKDIPAYKEWVERYYSDIKIMPAISDQDMNAMLAEESRLHTTEFNTNCALYELYTYAVKYNEQLTVTLEEDEFSQKQRLAYKLEQVHNIMAADANA